MKGLKRLSAVIWTAIALLLLLRSQVWAILHDLPLAGLVAFALIGPLLAHLVSLWVIAGFSERPRS